MSAFTSIIAVLLAATALPAYAQTFPTKPVRVIIAFPPGSATDIIGRVITQKVSEYWGQTVLADNRGGAGGSIASSITAKAAPDGYTLIINSSAHAINPSMYARLPYDTQKDFVDIMRLVGQPNVLVVQPTASFILRHAPNPDRSISPLPAWAVARTSISKNSSWRPASTSRRYRTKDQEKPSPMSWAAAFILISRRSRPEFPTFSRNGYGRWR
jgi:hypothetical protein